MNSLPKLAWAPMTLSVAHNSLTPSHLCGGSHSRRRAYGPRLTRERCADMNVEEFAELVEKANNGNQTVPTVIFSDGTAMTNPSLASIREHLGA